MSDQSVASSAAGNIERPIRRSVPRKLLYLLGWFTFAALLSTVAYLFYFQGYRWLIANDSYSSTVELVRRKLLAGRDAATLVIGNSAAAEGFPASFYNKLGGKSVPSLNLGVPSGHMFLFEKILGIALQSGLRPQAVVLVVTPEIFTFSASPYYDYLKNDLSVVKVELTLQDALLMRHHGQSFFNQLEYAAPILLRPALYTADLRNFAAHPVQRVKDAVFVSEWLNSLKAIESFPEPNHSFTVCQAEPLEELGKRLETERQKPDNPLLADLERVWSGYEGRASVGDALKVDAFESERLRGLLDRFADQAPHVFLVPAPYYDPRFTQLPAKYRDEFDQEMTRLAQASPRLHVLSAFPVDCTMMMDTVHLNRNGGEQFAAYLHEEIERAIGTGTQPSRPADARSNQILQGLRD